jgi:hypothetical protein
MAVLDPDLAASPNGPPSPQPGPSDVAIFLGPYSDYLVVATKRGNLEITVTGPDGTDLLRNVELLKFDNGMFDVTTGTFTPNSVSISTSSVVVEGDGRPVSFTFARTGDLSSGFAVRYTTETEGATAADFTKSIRPGSVYLRPGQAMATLSLGVVNDRAVEGLESLTLKLVPGSFYEVGEKSAATAIIHDNDEPSLLPPVVSVADTTAFEEGGRLSFDVSLSSPSPKAVTISFLTRAGTAIAGTDVISATGTLTFAPGETHKRIEVAIQDDFAVEPSETVLVALTSAVGATISRSHATGTILSSDTRDISDSRAKGTETESRLDQLPPDSGTKTAEDDLAPGSTTGALANPAGLVSEARKDGGVLTPTFSAPAEIASPDPPVPTDLSDAASRDTAANPGLDRGTADSILMPPATPNADTAGTGSVGGLVSTDVHHPVPRETIEAEPLDPGFSGGSSNTFLFNFVDPADSPPASAPAPDAEKRSGVSPSISSLDVAVNETDGQMTFVARLTDLDPAGESVRVDLIIASSAATDSELSGVLEFEPGQRTQTITFEIDDDTKFEGNETWSILLAAFDEEPDIDLQEYLLARNSGSDVL